MSTHHDEARQVVKGLESHLLADIIEARWAIIDVKGYIDSLWNGQRATLTPEVLAKIQAWLEKGKEAITRAENAAIDLEAQVSVEGKLRKAARDNPSLSTSAIREIALSGSTD